MVSKRLKGAPLNPQAMKVAVGSTNPVKLEAAKSLSAYGDFAFTAVDASSGVTHQPMSEEETREGAINRARDALSKVPDATYAVGIEGGVRDDGERMWCFGCCAIADRNGRVGTGFSGEFQLPPSVRSEILKGGELGPVMDRLLHRKDVKKQEGAVGVLTRNVIKRPDQLRPAVIYAFVPFLNEELYKEI